MAKKFPVAAKMTDEALKTEYYVNTDHRYFSLRTRHVENEMSKRGFWTLNDIDNALRNNGIWER